MLIYNPKYYNKIMEFRIVNVITKWKSLKKELIFMKKIRKIMAFVMAIALITCGVNVNGITLKAAETVYTDIEINAYYNTNNNSGRRINLGTNAKLPGKTGFYEGLTIETNLPATVKEVYRAADNTIMLILWGAGSTLKDGDYVTIKAGKAVHKDDSSIGINIKKDYTIVYNGEKNDWELMPELTEIPITGFNNIYYDASGHWRMNLKTSATFPTSGEYEGATIEVNGNKINSWLYNNSGMLLLVMAGWTDENVADGTTVTLKKGHAVSKKDKTLGISIPKDYTYVYDANTQIWSPYVHTEYSKITGTGIASSTFYKEGSSKHWRFYANVSGSFPTSDTAKKFYGASVYLNGSLSDKTRAAEIYKSGNQLGFLMWNYHDEKPQLGDTVTLKAGKYKDNGDATIGIEVTKDINFKWDGQEWYYVVAPDESATFDFDSTYNNGGDKGSIFLTSNDNREVPSNSGKITAVKSEPESGIFYNGEETECYLQKFNKTNGTTGYKVVLDNVSQSIVRGDLITIKGIFSYNNYAVNYQVITLIYDGEKWNEYELSVPSEYEKTVALTINGERSKVDSKNVTLLWESTKGVVGELNQAVWSGIDFQAIDKNGQVTDLGVLAMTKDNRGMLKMTISRDLLPIGEFTIVAKSGELTPVNTGFDKDVVVDDMYVIKDSYAYVNDYGVGYKKFIVCGNTTGANAHLTLNGESNGSTLKFNVDGNSLTTNVVLSPANVDSGIFVNGVRMENLSIKKVSDTCLSVEGDFKNNDHVVVVGRFEGDEEFIQIEGIAAKYNGSSWVEGELNHSENITLNIADDEYVVEGSDVTIKKNGSAYNKKVLYSAGEYTVSRRIDNVTLNYAISLYRPNDINQNNSYDVIDLIKIKKYEMDNNVLSGTSLLAANEGSANELRHYIAGKTKADEKLPVKMIGETGNNGNEMYKDYSKFISNVSRTMNGTTVISMSDSNKNFKSASDFDEYGLDYVIDYDVNSDRELRVLQLTDTQIIDSAQKRYSSRLGTASTENWKPENMQELLFDCMRETIRLAQPDLIVLTGDNIFGEFDDNGTGMEALVAEMESYKIPWAPVYGNHDNECIKGVKWQNELFENATYCIYYSGHDIGGNSNYTIGLAKNGVLQRSIFMLDSNFCANISVYENGTKVNKIHINADGNKDNGEIITTPGMVDSQINWYRKVAHRVNEVAGKVIPSMLYYHVPTTEVWLAAKAACYQQGNKDKSSIKYYLGQDITTVQNGDVGFKYGNMLTYNNCYDNPTELLDIMNEVGSDSAAFGHEHLCGISMSYGGVRWTFGLKTGDYDSSPSEQGGTLFTISQDGSDFTVKNIVGQRVSK